MKALSLWQPWASLVIHGHKQFETRPAILGDKFRGLLAIHATKEIRDDVRLIVDDEQPPFYFRKAFTEIGSNLDHLPTGAVLGIVRVIDIRPTEFVADHLDERELAFGNYEPGRRAWMLEIVKVFGTPIPAKGHQGFWEWDAGAFEQLAAAEIEPPHLFTGLL